MDEMVYTPAGLVRKSNVHLVDSEHHLNIKNGHIQIIHTKTGTLSQEFADTLTENIIGNNRSTFSYFKNNNPTNDSSGWNTFTY